MEVGSHKIRIKNPCHTFHFWSNLIPGSSDVRLYLIPIFINELRLEPKGCLKLKELSTIKPCQLTCFLINVRIPLDIKLVFNDESWKRILMLCPYRVIRDSDCKLGSFISLLDCASRLDFILRLPFSGFCKGNLNFYILLLDNRLSKLYFI